MVGIALAVYEGEYGLAFLPPVLACEPTRRFWEEEHEAEQKGRWDHLNAPGNAEDGSAVGGRGLTAYVSGTEGYAVCEFSMGRRGSVLFLWQNLLVEDEDTPGDRPLLGTNKTTALRGRSQFGNVDRDLSGLDSDGESVDNAADNKHRDILGCARDGRANHPMVPLVDWSMKSV